jgi:hypothetical protein
VPLPYTCTAKKIAALATFSDRRTDKGRIG